MTNNFPFFIDWLMHWIIGYEGEQKPHFNKKNVYVRPSCGGSAMLIQHADTDQQLQLTFTSNNMEYECGKNDFLVTLTVAVF